MWQQSGHLVWASSRSSNSDFILARTAGAGRELTEFSHGDQAEIKRCLELSSMAYGEIEKDDKNGCHLNHEIYFENIEFDENQAILKEG